MPQKKNPDVAELARGKTGRVYGHLLGLLTTLKGLPLAYNRDLQEDKEGFFDTVDTLEQTLEVFAGMVSTLHVDEAVMRRAATGGFALATDIADYLVRAGLPFRQAHAVVAGLVRHAIEQGKTLEQLSLDEYKRFSPLFQQDVKEVTLERSLAARDVPGGTAPARVRAALRSARMMVDAG
jgi:argininosuccinate lyase